MPETFRAVRYLPPDHIASCWDLLVLRSDERRVRRRRLELVHGDFVLVDFPETVELESKGRLQLEDGRMVGIEAAEELLYEIRGRDPVHLMQLCWHLGNRHTPAQIGNEWEAIGPRILIRRDHVLADMLRKLGATVTEISEPFTPVAGAYHGHDHAEHGDRSHALLRR
jgi:urease accessory protein